MTISSSFFVFIQFHLSKDDYSGVMRILMENFAENLRNQIASGSTGTQEYHYREAQQERQEEALRNKVIQKQKGLN